RAEAAHMTFAIEDNGVGISEADLPRIGEPYFQAGSAYDRRYGGTGLGLSIVKGLVQLHGGEIAIRSRIGEGTRVTVRLPLDCERARATKSGNAAIPAHVMNYPPAKVTPQQANVAVACNPVHGMPVKKSA
ncbi:MAG: ATP-binding protein, partial [Xanthobacteraceae bacterium]